MLDPVPFRRAFRAMGSCHVELAAVSTAETPASVRGRTRPATDLHALTGSIRLDKGSE